MRPILRSSLTVLVLIGTVWLASHSADGDEGKKARRIDKATAQHLVAEAVYGAARDLDFFDFDSSISRKFTPPFLAFEGLTMPPAEGIFGVFAVNP